MPDYSDYPEFRYTFVGGMRMIDLKWEMQVSKKRNAIDNQIAAAITRWLNRPENETWRANFVEFIRVRVQARQSISTMIQNTVDELPFYRGMAAAMDIDHWIMDTEHRGLMFMRAFNTVANRIENNNLKFQESEE